VSAFLRNIARRAAGLPAEVPVRANSAVDVSAALPDVASTTEQPVPASIAPPAPVPVTIAPPSPVQGVQRLAETPPAAAAAPAPATAVPVASPPIGRAPLWSPSPPGFSSATPAPQRMSPVPPSSRLVEPAPSMHAVAPAHLSPAPSEVAAVPVPQPTVIREIVREIPAKVSESTGKTAVPVVPTPVQKAPLAQGSENLKAVQPRQNEHMTHETLQKVIDRIYATEPTPREPAAEMQARNAHVPETRNSEIETHPKQALPEPQVNSRQAPRVEQATPPAAPEKRTVHVQIGLFELKLSAAPAPQPTSSAAAGGFEEFGEIRMYRV
jgi:hypothetical protein